MPDRVGHTRRSLYGCAAGVSVGAIGGGAVTGLDWLERFVQLDVAVRATFASGLPPIAAVALLALVIATAILMAHTFESLLNRRVVFSGGAVVGVTDRPLRRPPLSAAWPPPAGGPGPRAPGGYANRP